MRLIRHLTRTERRGTSSVRFSPHFPQATPPCTRYVLRGYSSTPQRKVGFPTPALQTRSDLDAHTRPNRDASRSITAWPLHRRPYGTTLAVYPSKRVRAMTSVRGRTRTGRMWFRRTAPFETWYKNPSTHANAAHQVREIAGARYERTLFPVTCMRLILIEAPSPAYRRGMLRVAKPVEQTRRRPQCDSTPNSTLFTAASISTPVPWTSVSSTRLEKHWCTGI